jgi:hypothetical protein
MKPHTIALFGEAEKGDYSKAYYCQTLPQMLDCLGNPPPESKGLYFAVQSILLDYSVLFFRVREEGFSQQDYFLGLAFLKKQKLFTRIMGICAPGVGNGEIINEILPICHNYRSILITSEADLYDYLTASS